MIDTKIEGNLIKLFAVEILKSSGLKQTSYRKCPECGFRVAESITENKKYTCSSCGCVYRYSFIFCTGKKR